MNAKRIALGAALGLLLVLPASAQAKSMYGLQLGDSIMAQSELAPTIFAGEPCVEVVERSRGNGSNRAPAGVTEIEAGRSYWQMVLFSGTDAAELEEASPTLILRDLETGETIRVDAVDIQMNAPGAYATLTLRFPRPGIWNVALDDGLGHTYDYGDGTVISTEHGPPGEALTEGELAVIAGPDVGLDTCTTTATSGFAAASDDDGSWLAPLAIGLGAAAALVALALGLRRGRVA